MGRVLRFFIAVFLVPVVIAISRAFYCGLILNIEAVTAGRGFYFVGGAAAYLVARVLIEKLDTLYVFGHELTHALATVLTGGRVKSFHVMAKSGSVTTTKTNAFIELSPYLIPIYTLFLTLAWFLTSLARDISNYTLPFIFLVGFTLTFHLSSTVSKLKIKQPDLSRVGTPLSLLLIYVANITITGIVLGAMFSELSIRDFFFSFWDYLKGTYGSVYEQLFVI